MSARRHAFAAATGLALACAALAPSASAALKAGDKAPAFKAPAYLAGNPFQFDLADALKKGPVVVYFFPAAHTSGCNLEAHLFSEAPVLARTGGRRPPKLSFEARATACALAKGAKKPPYCWLCAFP